MSDLQTNIEIEDVLASIRRLVSDSDVGTSAAVAPPKQAAVEVPVSAPQHSANSPAAPEKLVLSPDQMIERPVTRPVDADASQIEGAEPLVLSSPAQAVEAAHEDDMNAPSLLDPVTDMWHLARQNPENDPQDDSHTESSDAGLSEVLGDTPSQTAIDARSQLLSTIAELEAAVTSKTDDFEPDGSERTPVFDWAATTSNGAIFGSQAATTRISEVDTSASEEAEIEEAEVIDAAAAALVDDPSPQPTDAEQADDALDDFLNAETAMDEGALRELVTEIVRQELQGPLGERITRNVRKLVRREIYRALASEEFN